MPRSTVREGRLRADEIPVRLHDVATGLAIGIGLLKVVPHAGVAGRKKEGERAVTLLEDSLTQLRTLIAATARSSGRHSPPRELLDSIRREANRLKIRLQLHLEGSESWLGSNQEELIFLVAREGLRNVSRHAGTAACQIAIDLTTCPFEMRIRDWGAGLSATSQAGSGITLLRQLASGMGCELGVASHPGLGTELVLVGPTCAKDRDVYMREQQGPGNSGAIDPTPPDGEPAAEGGQVSPRMSRLGK